MEMVRKQLVLGRGDNRWPIHIRAQHGRQHLRVGQGREPALEALCRFGYRFDAGVGAERPGGGSERWKPIATEYKHRESGLAAGAVQPEDWGR